MRPPHHSRGFTMLEVLMAIMVITFGLLGLASLYINTLKSTAGSNLRSVATQQAYDISDRIRANRLGLNSGFYNNQQGQLNAACFTTTGCTTQQMAQMDIFAWNELNATSLPGGVGMVCTDSTPNDGVPAAPACDNAPNASYVIKVWWDERDSSGQLQRFTTILHP